MPAGRKDAITDGLSQPGDVDLDRLDRRPGRSLAPDLVHDPIGGNGFAAVEQQDCEDRALLRSAEWGRLSIDEDLEWAKNAEVHHAPLASVPPLNGSFTGALSVYDDRLPLGSSLLGETDRTGRSATEGSSDEHQAQGVPRLAAGAVAFCLLAPTASALPAEMIDGDRPAREARPGDLPLVHRTEVVDRGSGHGLDWGDAGISAAAMLGLSGSSSAWARRSSPGASIGRRRRSRWDGETQPSVNALSSSRFACSPGFGECSRTAASVRLAAADDGDQAAAGLGRVAGLQPDRSLVARGEQRVGRRQVQALALHGRVDLRVRRRARSARSAGPPSRAASARRGRPRTSGSPSPPRTARRSACSPGRARARARSSAVRSRGSSRRCDAPSAIAASFADVMIAALSSASTGTRLPRFSTPTLRPV